MKYINTFLTYSIIGYIFEIILTIIFKRKPISGIMYGPWTPIYGIGVLIILFIYRFVNNFHLNKLLEIIIFFILITIILTLIEQLGGVLLDKLFHKSLWNYSNYKLHITKYIAVEVSLIWGLFSIIIAYIIHPLFSKAIYNIPFLISALLFILFSIDAIVTFTKNL